MASDNKLGRNTSCPCGSGKKYKQCCLGKRQAAETRKHVGWSAILMVLGFVGAALLWNAKGSGAGLAAIAASIIVATGVYILRDPAPPRKNAADSSAINFGGK